jgi:anti-sigma-K factor RskA
MLEAAPAERKRTWEPVELPGKPLISGALIATVAAIAGIGAIALGMWAFATSVRAAEKVVAAPTVPTPSQELISFLANPSTKRIPLDGSRGRLVLAVGSGGRGVLLPNRLPSAPAGKSYQAWVIKPRGIMPRSAAVFSGAELFVRLAVPVRRGSILAVSIEPAGGSRAPTRTPTFVAHRD